MEFKNVNYEEEYRYLRDWHIFLLNQDLKPAVLQGDFVFVDEDGKPIADEATRAPDTVYVTDEASLENDDVGK